MPVVIEQPPITTIDRGYIASAVHFDGSASLRSSSLGSTNNQFLLYSYWIKINPANFTLVWVIDPQGGYSGNDQFNGSGGNSKYNSILNEGISNFIAASAAAISSSNWMHILFACQTDTVVPPQLAKLYINDVDVTDVITPLTTLFTILTNGLPFFVGDDTFTDVLLGDLSEFYFAPGQFLDLTVTANRRKFISASGKPVDLGSSGALPTGTAPAIFFSGNAAAFSTNQGTGGAFTLTGSLTNASTSPSS